MVPQKKKMSVKKDKTAGEEVLLSWMQATGRAPFGFQQQAWQAYLRGESGLLNAPTGFGKTYALFLPVLMDAINKEPKWQERKNNGLRLLWVTPLRALAKDLQRAMQEVCDAISLPWQVGLRTGDTTQKEKTQQKKSLPEILIITPESLHLMLSHKGYPDYFKHLDAVVADEWHELMGNKRGVQVELALSRLRALAQSDKRRLRTWAISATIGNLEQAMEVALGVQNKGTIIRATEKKKIEVQSILPDTIERFPWAGHLGVSIVDKVLPVIEQSRTTLLFTNTRGQSEVWYQALLNAQPDLAGVIALHHGSIDTELRVWIENALHEGILKVVVCTSSLDLGVDFRPVDTVIQVGSPKGIARFLQRAGRSGHAPHEVSRIYFLPTHSLELVESAALKKAVAEGTVEQKQPVMNAYDVLIQYLCTLALGEGFEAKKIFEEVKSTFAYQHITADEWRWVMDFITTGGESLAQYEEYKRVVPVDGICRITDKRIAMRHRMSIGTIVGDSMINVKLLKGGRIGVIEETFISKLKPGDVFTLAGRKLEFLYIREMNVITRISKVKKSIAPSWLGGRVPLSANMSVALRETYTAAAKGTRDDIELRVLKPLFELQEQLSHVPLEDETLIEYIASRDGFHLFVYPFEGRLVHEVMAYLLAYRISRISPITFSIAMNDYGFELLSDQAIPIEQIGIQALFTTDNLLADIQKSINATEMAKRKFRPIAVIAGLVFRGYPGAPVKNKHLQSSSSLLFTVFNEHEPGNLLLKQAFTEAFDEQIEEVRLRTAMERIYNSTIIVKYPPKLTPLSFPIKVDSLRENMSSEDLRTRVLKMQKQLEKN